jgi:hypothetical protein
MSPRGIRLPSSPGRWGTRRCRGPRDQNGEPARHEPTVDHPVTGKPVAFGSGIGSDIGTTADHGPTPTHRPAMTPRATVDGWFRSVNRLPCRRGLRILQNTIAVRPRSVA